MLHRAACLVAACGLALAAPLHAQIEGGFQGSVNSGVREGSATIGLGGRVGAYLFRTGDFAWKADADFDYFFASCPNQSISCYAWHGHLNILGTRKLGEPVLGYFGFGAVYQRSRYYSTSGGDLNATYDHGGVNLIVGAQLPQVSAVRPFFEARFAIFDGAPNQLVISLGALFNSAGRSPGS